MKMQTGYGLILLFLIVFAGNANAQADQFCAEAGLNPTLDSPFAQVPYVFGHINLQGSESGAKFPKVTVSLIDTQQSINRWTVEKSGNYCFKLRNGRGGTLIIEVDGVEMTRRSLSTFGPAQQREDFEIVLSPSNKRASPGVVSAKYVHPVNPKTVELYERSAKHESKKEFDKAIEILKEITAIDPADFIGWAKLGMLYIEIESLTEAEAAFRKSLELKVEYTPAWIQMGKIRVAQKGYEPAIEIFKHAITLEPASPTAFRLLGEAYLQAKKGSLGAEALNEALRLDPLGMAECHLLLAKLYEMAGAKNRASREYKLFLTKVPEHPDKKKFEQFIKSNPE